MWAVPLLEKLLSSDFCQSELTEGIGNHTLVKPWGLMMSTRVVTSNVRQLPAMGANLRSVAEAAAVAVCAKLIAGNAHPAMATADLDIN